MTKYHVFEDPGHGWARVTRKELVRLGIDQQISTFSFQRKGNVYLEEDSDLSLFIRTKKERGEEVKFIEHHTNKQSKIRSYDHYRRSDSVS